MKKIICPEPTCQQPETPVDSNGIIGRHYRSPTKTFSDENLCRLGGSKYIESPLQSEKILVGLR